MRATFIGLLCALGLGLAQEADPSGVAALRVALLSPDAPQFDLLIDGQLTLRDLPFAQVSRYLLLSAGRHDLELFPHQAPASGEEGENGAVEPLEPVSITVELAAGAYYTLVASGFYNPPASTTTSGSLVIQMDEGVAAQVRGPRNYLVTVSTPTTLNGLEPGDYTVTASREGYRTAQFEVEVTSGNALTLPISLQEGSGEMQPVTAAPELEVAERAWVKTQLQLYEDGYTAFPAAGQAFVRFVHAAPASAPLRIAATFAPPFTDEEQPASEPQVLAERLAFPNATPYLAVPVGLEKLVITVAGSDLVLSELNGVKLESGTIYTVFLTGSVASGAVTPIPYLDAVVRGTLP